MSVYVCFCCGYPIIFRRWRGNPRQVFHIPSGWHCWSLWKTGMCRASLPVKLKFPGTTPKKEREKLLKEAQKHCKSYRRTGDTKSIHRFVQRQLHGNRSDVVRDLLADLGDEADAHNRRLLRAVVSSTAWGRFVRQLRADTLCEDYQKTDDAKPLLEFLEALVTLGDLTEAVAVGDRALHLLKKARDKALCWFLRACAYEFKGDAERADAELRGLTDYLKGLGRGFRVTKWHSSPLVAAIENRLGNEDRRKLLLLVSLLTGEIGRAEFEKRSAVS